MLRQLACCILVAMLTRGVAYDWRLQKTHEQQLPDSIDCWEPALAVGPAGEVYVSAGRRNAPLRSPNYDQRQVVWRSDDRGVTFKPPKPVSSDGSKHYDQRIAVDRRGTVYLSYLDTLRTPNGRPQSRLRLAISRDRGDP